MKKAAVLNVRSTARRLGCTLKYVYDLVHSGRLPAEKVERQWRIDESAVDAWLKRRGA